MCKSANHDYQISGNYPLTEITARLNLKNVPGHETRHNFKQIEGGSKNTQPPAQCGFFMPATLGDCTNLPGVARNKKPSCGNTCSAIFDALEGSRNPFGYHNFKQFEEVNAMYATNHRTATPVASAKGLTPTSHSARCIIPSDVLLNALVRAKQKRHQDDRANAYTELLNHFHRAILPAFFTETEGNLSEVARLLGLHRDTVKTYASNAEIDMTRTAVKAVNA